MDQKKLGHINIKIKSDGMSNSERNRIALARSKNFFAFEVYRMLKLK